MRISIPAPKMLQPLVVQQHNFPAKTPHWTNTGCKHPTPMNAPLARSPPVALQLTTTLPARLLPKTATRRPPPKPPPHSQPQAQSQSTQPARQRPPPSPQWWWRRQRQRRARGRARAEEESLAEPRARCRAACSGRREGRSGDKGGSQRWDLGLEGRNGGAVREGSAGRRRGSGDGDGRHFDGCGPGVVVSMVLFVFLLLLLLLLRCVGVLSSSLLTLGEVD